MPRLKIDNVEPDTTPQVVEPEKVVAEQDKQESVVDKELKGQSGASILSAFSAYPSGIFFAGEGENEEIILLLRAHVVTNISWVLVTVGLILGPLILFPILGGLGIFTGLGMGLGVAVAWYLLTLTYAFVNFLYWYFNVYIVTNERVIDVDWYSIVIRKVSATQIAKIQDVSAVQIGVLSGIFDFGHVEIQTAAEEPNFEFLNVPHPQLVAKKIHELMAEEEKEWEHGH